MAYFLTSDSLGFRHWTEDDKILAALLWKDADVMRHMGDIMAMKAFDLVWL